MTQDKLEELLISNAQTVSGTTELVDRLSKDVEKLIQHMDEVLPFRGKVHQLEKQVRVLQENQAQAQKELDIYITIAKYPKISVLVVGCMYLFTIKDIRDPILAILKLV